MIIVIDGLSGSGKSSTARAVADRLGIQYLDSGALYRAVTWIWLEEGRPEDSFIDILSSKTITFYDRGGQFHVEVDGENLAGEIRKQRVSEAVSQVAARPEVRAFVNELMREAVRKNHFIADGRDLGSAVFPDAELKIFMDASLDVRAERRYAELKRSGEKASMRNVRQNLADRDRQDQSREADPLVKTDDAVELDTTDLTFDDQVNRVVEMIRERFPEIEKT